LYGLRKNYANGILGDEMGLGKTLQILAFFQLIKNTEKENHGSFLVVCPLSVLSSWQNEVDTWTTLRAVQWYGNSEKRRSTWQMAKNQGMAGLFSTAASSLGLIQLSISIAFDIILTTYETVIADNVRISHMGPWSCVVLDEGHRIKNFATKLSISVKGLKTRQRLILTG
jgi:SWI/SNF-related matrix-associated actin-dependent regulator of chromatin subfamily A member 5